MKKRLRVGIDPGYTGWVAVVDEHHGFELRTCFPMPLGGPGRSYSRLGVQSIASQLVKLHADELAPLGYCEPLIIIEQPPPVVAKLGGFTSGHASLYECIGLWEGAFPAAWPVLKVLPKTWQAMLKGLPGKTPKERYVRLAEALYPSAPLHGPRGGVHDGLAAALCLARWMPDRQ